MSKRKFKLTNNTISVGALILYRIQATKSFSDIRKGDLGGFVMKEENLSQEGNCWIYNNARAFDNAKVLDNAGIYNNAEIGGAATVKDSAFIMGNAQIFGNAIISNNAQISGYSRVSGDAIIGDSADVYGYADICGNAVICSFRDYIVFKNNWSSGRYFTYTRSNKRWKVGCFYGSGEELIAKAYKDSEDSGKHYELYVKMVDKIEKLWHG